MSDDPTRADIPDEEPAAPPASVESAPPQPSILAQLDVEGNEAPRVHLRDIGTGSSSESTAGARGADAALDSMPDFRLRRGSDRYEVIGELARGGVGVVLRGRDRDIGRDVAMKVLRDEHKNRPEVIERFVEEAQIGGQLQHPGIVPIYELGLKDDDRPYFTMKLVKGDTLAALLAKRRTEEAGQDAGRPLLRVFQSVCQTMAYAHSRGVIHRDLKPANIMVGAFGEVQVVDWGLAKVLAVGGVADERRARRVVAEQTIVATVRTENEGSDSIDGTILGTPAYMPPEQALGQIDDLDERADVFALGGILCEILTGQAPYVADESPVVVKAVRSELHGAFSRLDACQADPELIALARRCLSPTRSDRPRDAARLAEHIGTYLESVDARAHRFEVALAEAEAETARAEREASEQRATAGRARQSAKEAQARAEQAGHARRQTRMIGFALAGLITVGVGAWMWVRMDARAVRRAARGHVESALSEASYHEGREDWDAAVAAANKAMSLADSGGASDPVRALARTTQTRLMAHKQIVDATRERDERDLQLVARLEEIRALRLDGASGREWDRQFDLAFKSHDIDLEAVTGRALGDQIATSVERHAIATFLDEWALLRKATLDQVPDRWQPLLVAARIADPDPDRTQIRRALSGQARSSLEELEARLDPAGTPSATWSLLGNAWASMGQGDRAVAALRKAQRLRPQDVWLSVHLAQNLARGTSPDWAEVVRFYGLARALRPQSAPIRVALAHALAQSGHAAEAIRELRGAVRIQPQFAYAHNALGRLVLKSEGAKAALPYIRQALAEDPEFAQGHAVLAEVLRSLGQLDGAETAAQKAVALDDQLIQGHENLFRVLAEKRDLDGALRAVEKAARFAERYRKRMVGQQSVGSGPPRGVGAPSPGVAKAKPQSLSLRRLRRAWLDPSTRRDSTNAVVADRGRVYAYALELKAFWPEAVDAWKRLLARDPSDLTSQRHLARLLALAPDEDIRDRLAAGKLAAQILEREPTDPEAHIYVALAKLKDGETTESLALLKAVEAQAGLQPAARAFVLFAQALVHAARLEVVAATDLESEAIKVIRTVKTATALLAAFRIEVRSVITPLRKAKKNAGDDK